MYKINFTVEELSKFNTIERQKTKETLMSIYAYLLKLNEKKNDLYQNAGIDTDNISLKISFRKFLAAYNRYHSKISLPTLKFHIDKLKDLGLIAVQKVKNVFTYFFFRFGLNKKLNENLNTSDSSEAIENTHVKANEEKPKYLNPELKDLDSTSNNSCCNVTEPTTVDNFDYEKYLADQKKNITWDEVNTLLSRAFKLLKVRSNWIKGTVISKLSLYYSNVTRKHAMSYICTCISDAREKYYKRHENFIKDKYSSGKKSTFNNFEQRTYDFEDLEKKLLGWI